MISVLPLRQPVYALEFCAMEDGSASGSESLVARTRRALESLERLEQARSLRTAAEARFEEAWQHAREALEGAGYTEESMRQALQEEPEQGADSPPAVLQSVT